MLRLNTVSLGHTDFNFSRVQFRIHETIASVPNLAFHLNHVFPTKSPGQRVDFAVLFRVEDHLCFAIPVSQVDKNQILTMVAIAVNPASQGDSFAFISTAQDATSVSS